MRWTLNSWRFCLINRNLKCFVSLIKAECRVGKVNQEFKVCFWSSRLVRSVTERENSRDVFLQNLRWKREKSQEFDCPNESKAIAIISRICSQRQRPFITFVNELKIYKFWRENIYDTTILDYTRHNVREKKNPLKWIANNNNNAVEVYACPHSGRDFP